MKQIIFCLCVVMSLVLQCLAIETTDVQVEAVSPWGKVWVTYELEEDLEDMFGTIVVSNRTTGTVHMSDGGVNFISTKGKHSVVWDIKAQGMVFDSAELEFLGITWRKGVQLWEGGPYWAECNIGAENPEDYGYYFRWGATIEGRKNANGPQSNVNDTWLENNGWIDEDANLTMEHDAAMCHWGGKWRMPRIDEIRYLSDNCDKTWITQNGVTGYLVTGKGNYQEKSIFIPTAGELTERGYDWNGARGYYWSSALERNCSRALTLYFEKKRFGLMSIDRNFVYPIRPVAGFTK